MCLLIFISLTSNRKKGQKHNGLALVLKSITKTSFSTHEKSQIPTDPPIFYQKKDTLYPKKICMTIFKSLRISLIILPKHEM